MKRKTVIAFMLILFLGCSSYGQLYDSVPGMVTRKTGVVNHIFNAPSTMPVATSLKNIQNTLDVKSAIRIDSFYVRYESQANNATDYRNTVPAAIFSSMFYQGGRAQFNASVFRVPLTVKYQYQEMSGFAFPGSMSVPFVEFNRELFVKSMSERIRSSFDAKTLVGERLAAIQNLKDLALKDLKEELLRSIKESGSEVYNKVKQLSDWKELSNGDMSYFTKKMLSEKDLEKQKSNELLIARMQEKINNHEEIDNDSYQTALREVKQVKDIQAVVQVIMKYKKKWDESGLVKLIRKMEIEKDLQLKEILSNPSVLSQMAKNKLSLQKIEKLFLSIKQLQTGASASSLTPMTLDQSLRSSGFNLETIGKGSSSLFVTMGKLPELFSVAERSMSVGSQVNTATSMAGVSFGNRHTSSNSQQEQFSKVSLFSFATSSSASGINMLSPLSGSVARNIVFTIRKKMSIGSRGSLTTEISKSATQEQNREKPEGGSTGNSFSASKMLSGASGDFFSNMGLAAEYSNEFPGINLSHEFEFRYTGDGYSNQGNSYLLSGSKELYHSLRKTFFNQKVNVTVKNRYKSYSLDNSGRSVNNLSHTIDIRWKFSKGNYVALKYQPARSIGYAAGRVIQNDVSTERLAADLNIRARISRLQVQNFVNLAYLSTRTAFAGYADERYKTIQLNSMHTVMKDSKQFFINTNFNYAFKSGSLPYLNNSLLMEGGVTYDLGDKIKLSSAMNYNATQNWYSQLAFKQGISGHLGKKFDLDFTIDVAKNFKVLQAYPVQNFRSDISVRYLIF